MKISLNLEENILKWFDRFERENTRRTETVHTDICFFSLMICAGVQSIYSKFSYSEFICFLQAYWNTWITSYLTPAMIRANIVDFIEFEIIESSLDTKKEELLSKIKGLNEMELYGLIDMVRKWKDAKPILDLEKQLESIGIKNDYFIPEVNQVEL